MVARRMNSTCSTPLTGSLRNIAAMAARAPPAPALRRLPRRDVARSARTKEEDSDASDYESHLPKEEQWGEHQKDHHLSASEEDKRGVTMALDAAELLAKEGKLGRDHSLLTTPGLVPKTAKVRKLPE